MWIVCLFASVSIVVLTAFAAFVMSGMKFAKRNFSPFRALFAGVFVATVLMFFPVNIAAAEQSALGVWRTLLVSVFHSMQVFTIGCDFDVVKDSIGCCPEALRAAFQAWAATLYVLAPVFTFGFVLSLFKNISAYLKYIGSYFKEVYIFSELNEKALVLANDLKKTHRKAVVVFTDVFEDNSENTCELIGAAKKMGAICFEKDILAIDFSRHAAKPIFFFAIGADETENLNQSLKLIENYRNRENTHIYIFSTKIESEILLTAVDKGVVKVRRINEVQSLVNRVLYEQGEQLFTSAKKAADGKKHICAVVIGLGNHGTEMLKALTWYGQMDGYRLQIHAFDKDPLAEEKFIALAPELMSSDYNGVDVEGEAQYQITIHSGIDVDTITFANEISRITDATYVVVSLGDDDVNIKTAVNLRMYFERMKIHPVIQAIVYNSQQKKALAGITNYRGQAYDISFIGDLESSFTEAVIIDSELEEDALRRHMKWGKEEEFWTYQYNYRSSVASAIHMRARVKCAIPGAAKKESELTEAERNIIEVLEHRRWNAYMRAEGYVYSGSNDKASRNDLAKMHHDLVDFSSLTEEEKRKDSRVGTE
jgi:hypothetical protein